MSLVGPQADTIYGDAARGRHSAEQPWLSNRPNLVVRSSSGRSASASSDHNDLCQSGAASSASSAPTAGFRQPFFPTRSAEAPSIPPPRGCPSDTGCAYAKRQSDYLPVQWRDLETVPNLFWLIGLLGQKLTSVACKLKMAICRAPAAATQKRSGRVRRAALQRNRGGPGAPSATGEYPALLRPC